MAEATVAETVRVKPVAWLYRRARREDAVSPIKLASMKARGYEEVPLYAHPQPEAAEILSLRQEVERLRADNTALDAFHLRVDHRFVLGQRVTKTKGSSWTGKIVGFYSTSLTPIGYAVESENEPGSVQIYPEGALAALSKEEGR